MPRLGWSRFSSNNLGTPSSDLTFQTTILQSFRLSRIPIRFDLACLSHIRLLLHAFRSPVYCCLSFDRSQKHRIWHRPPLEILFSKHRMWPLIGCIGIAFRGIEDRIGCITGIWHRFWTSHWIALESHDRHRISHWNRFGITDIGPFLEHLLIFFIGSGFLGISQQWAHASH